MRVLSLTLLAVAFTSGSALAQVDRNWQSDNFPFAYSQPTGPGKSRAEVVAELEAAKRNGDLIAQGDRGWKDSDLYPNRFMKPTEMPVDRATVRAELEKSKMNRAFIPDIYYKS